MTLFNKGDLVQFTKEYDSVAVGTVATYVKKHMVAFTEPTLSVYDEPVGHGFTGEFPYGKWYVPEEYLKHCDSLVIEPSEDTYNDLI